MSTLEGSITLQAFGAVFFPPYLSFCFLYWCFHRNLKETGKNINPFMSIMDSFQQLSG